MNTHITKKTMLVSVIGTAVVLGAALLHTPAMAAGVEGKLEDVTGGGRGFTVGGQKFKVSKSRTTITIAGKAANRGDLKNGLDCKVEGDKEASQVDCK
jgi:hypothetical protein